MEMNCFSTLVFLSVSLCSKHGPNQHGVDVELLRTHRHSLKLIQQIDFEHSQCVRHCVNWMWVYYT